MTASRFPHLHAGAAGAFACSTFRFVTTAVVALLALAATGRAQPPTVPIGWSWHRSFQETSQPWLVRCVLQLNEKEHLVAMRHQLFRTGEQRTAASRLLLELAVGDDIAFLAPVAGGRFAAGALRRGDVRLVDPDLGHVGTFHGVPNAFDAVAIGNDLLVVANPLWPQAGAHSGVWLLGPGRTPRELMPLVGPSAPLVLLANGDLVVGELGPVVPPPPGAARLLRVPANRISAALAGATLSMADVSAIGTGFTGLFDLAVDDQQRLHATDPATGVVVHTAPGGLTPTGTTLDVGAGRFALTLQYVPHAFAPFRGYQPPHEAPRMAVGTSDFATSYEWRHLRPARPEATVATGTTINVGPFAVDVTGAPPLGFVLALASPPNPGPEALVATLDGTPLWLALQLGSTFLITATTAAANGTATLLLHNPGGTPGRIDLQVVGVDPSGSGHLGSSHLVRLDLLP